MEGQSARRDSLLGLLLPNAKVHVLMWVQLRQGINNGLPIWRCEWYENFHDLQELFWYLLLLPLKDGNRIFCWALSYWAPPAPSNWVDPTSTFQHQMVLRNWYPDGWQSLTEDLSAKRWMVGSPPLMRRTLQF